MMKGVSTLHPSEHILVGVLVEEYNRFQERIATYRRILETGTFLGSHSTPPRPISDEHREKFEETLESCEAGKVFIKKALEANGQDLEVLLVEYYGAEKEQ
jgi:hypothetical protein